VAERCGFDMVLQHKGDGCELASGHALYPIIVSLAGI